MTTKLTTLMTGVFFCSSVLLPAPGHAEIQKQRFVVSLNAPLKAGDDALRLVMEICEIATFTHNDQALVVIETRNVEQLRDYLWTRSRTALQIGQLLTGRDVKNGILNILNGASKDTTNHDA